MSIDERYVEGVDHDEDEAVDDEPEACGEGMCHCHCDGRHVCGCDCPRCPYCQQIPENCECEDDEW